MPEISVRGLEMPESPIRKLAPLAAAAKNRGIKVYHLNIGQPDLPTPQVGLDALKNIDRTILEYSPSQGYLSYRQKLVGYYQKYNINVSADDIIITAGGSEAVLFAFMSCLNPGDEIIVPEPAYANYMAFAISAGAKIRTIATTIEEGFSLPKVEKFEELINERTRAIMICNPNNPTGYLYTRREMNQIRDLVKKYDLYLFSDEVYREFIYTGSPYISACHLEGIEQNVILIDSVSKRYSECGIRVGALITKNKEVRPAVMKFCRLVFLLLSSVRLLPRLRSMLLKNTIAMCMMSMWSDANASSMVSTAFRVSTLLSLWVLSIPWLSFLSTMQKNSAVGVWRVSTTRARL